MLKRLDADSWVHGRRASLEDVYPAVNEIIENVKAGGDAALYEYARKFDGCELESILVTEDEREDAYEEVDPKIIEYLIEAEARIAEFHEYQKKEDIWLRQMHPGITLGIKTTPLKRAGCYVPGGRASYPSTALMTVVPARVAGVESICTCTPPPADPMTIAALDIAGATEIVRAGGAQAIAAMALGTGSIEPVQKIVGPGNIYVTAAKMILRDHAEIDFPAGPSEVCIIADENSNPSFIAADILAQAEHDPNSACVLITESEALVNDVSAGIELMSKNAPRAEIIEKALKNSGYVLAADIRDAVSISDRIAPEHLSIQVSDPLPVLSAVQNAGSIFVGPYTPVACGDYASGTNHVLPTAGYASVYSGLNVSHFCKTSTVQIIDRDGLDEIGDMVEALAEAEGLFAHSESVKIRRK